MGEDDRGNVMERKGEAHKEKGLDTELQLAPAGSNNETEEHNEGGGTETPILTLTSSTSSSIPSIYVSKDSTGSDETAIDSDDDGK